MYIQKSRIGLLHFAYLVTFFFIALFVFPRNFSKVFADISSIEDYEVTVDINSDSTFEVTEKITYRATGDYSFIFRDLTLIDTESAKLCKDNPVLT